MWARVKGRTENELLRLPFKAAYMFRPGAILPLHGVRSKTRWMRRLYALASPIAPRGGTPSQQHHDDGAGRPSDAAGGA